MKQSADDQWPEERIIECWDSSKNSFLWSGAVVDFTWEQLTEEQKDEFRNILAQGQYF